MFLQSEEVKTEKESKITNEKGKKSRKPLKHKPIKKEFPEDDVNDKKDKENEIEKKSKETDNDDCAINGIRKSSRNILSKKKQASGDSVYEDAIQDQVNNNSNKSNKSNDGNTQNQNECSDNSGNSNTKSSKSLVVKIEKLKLSTATTTVESSNSPVHIIDPSPEKPIDATFASAVSDVGDENNCNGDINTNTNNMMIRPDETFITTSSSTGKTNMQDTFIIDKNHQQKNEIQNLKVPAVSTVSGGSSSESNNATFCVVSSETVRNSESNKNKNNDNDENAGNEILSSNSLLTEDESQDEEKNDDEKEIQKKIIVTKNVLPNIKPKPKQKNELFR